MRLLDGEEKVARIIMGSSTKAYNLSADISPAERQSRAVQVAELCCLPYRTYGWIVSLGREKDGGVMRSK